jgi:uroporphyrinogen-III synthase
MSTPQPLKGRGIVVTRPAHQAEHLAALVRGAGGEAILFPVLEIRDVADPAPLNALIDCLEEFDIAIFISPNAAERAMRVITARRGLPPDLAFAAIGGGGMRELARHGVNEVISPAGRFDSEALLDHPGLADVHGKRIVIFRGDGGREVLGDMLQVRGASVEYATCYRRIRPELDPEPLLSAWRRRALHAITVTSSQGLRHLAEIVGEAGAAALADTPLFAPHPRIAQAARDRGLLRVNVTGPGDEGLFAGLVAYFDIATP